MSALSENLPLAKWRLTLSNQYWEVTKTYVVKDFCG
jgi:hypothetical protein